MDVAGKILSEMVSILTSSHGGKSSADDKSFSSLLGKFTFGTSTIEDYFAFLEFGPFPFHRLVASESCTLRTLQEFLHHWKRHVEGHHRSQQTRRKEGSSSSIEDMPEPPSIRQKTKHGVTALHVAMFKNSLKVDDIIQILLDHESLQCDESCSCTTLASTYMDCGSSPLHILTGQSLTANEKALEVLLNADPNMILREDVNGDNAISLLWKNTMRFRWAISLMEGETNIDYIQNDADCSWMTIITPRKYIRCSRKLIEKVIGTRSGDIITMHELCALRRCPPFLLMLAMSKVYNETFRVVGSMYSLDDNGRLPIHHAVQSNPATYRCTPDYLKKQCHKSTVELLLDTFPESVMVRDDLGRLPIHYALENGCLYENDLLRLVELYPGCLKVQDPVSGLYPFMLVARNGAILSTVLPREPVPSIPPSILVSNNNESEQLDENFHWNYYKEWKKDDIPMSFLLLSLCPEVLQYNIATG